MFKLHAQLSQDCIFIGDLPISRVLLMNDARFPWCILVPRRNNVEAIYELNISDQQQLINESSCLSRSMLTFFQGEKINVAALGNIVPQLHIHHVVRFEVDEAWPKPIWGFGSVRLYDEEILQTSVAGLRLVLKNEMSLSINIEDNINQKFNHGITS